MNLAGNVTWLICGGLIIGLWYLLASVLLFISIIGIPFGLQTLKLGFLAFAPFGKEFTAGNMSGGALNVIMNIIWILIAGIEIAILHVVFAVILAITIIGIPFSIQHLKLASLAIVPFGNKISNVATAP